MTTKNPYRKSSHLDVKKTRQLVRCFTEDLNASVTSNLTGINRNTVNKRFNYIRTAILYESIKTDKEIRKGIIEIDESYFGPRRIRGKRGRGAGGKTKVLLLLKRHGKVFVQIVPDCSAKSLLPVIRGKIDPHDSEVNTDGRTSYHGLVDLGYEKHYRVHHGQNEFVRGKKHINGIESFWSYTKRRLAKFNGIPKHKFMLHLKETEYRFNTRLQGKKLYNELLKLLRHFSLVDTKLV